MKNMKRSKMVLLVAFILMLSGCNNSSLDIKENFIFDFNEDIEFFIATDTHYLSNKINDHGEAFNRYVNSGDGKQLGYIEEILDSFVYEVKDKEPNVLIISGDLTNNGEKESHKDLADKLKEVEKSGTKVYVIPGNHDILNPWARGFKKDEQYKVDYITKEEFSSIYEDFGYKEAVSRDEESLSYLVTLSKDLWLLMIDSNEYDKNLKLGYPQGYGEIKKDTLEWMKQCLSLAKEKNATLIPVIHHNTIDHSEFLNEGYTLDNSKTVLELFKDNDVKLVFSGHIHIQDIVSDNKKGKEIYDIANNSLAVYPHQYGVLNYSPKDNSFKYNTVRVDVEGWGENQGSLDENLNNFEEYSKEYFGKFAYYMAYENLFGNKDFTEEEKRSMSEIMKILNLRFFAGTENLNAEDVVKERGFKLWEKAPDGFLKQYIWSILKDNEKDDNSLSIKIESKDENN